MSFLARLIAATSGYLWRAHLRLGGGEIARGRFAQKSLVIACQKCYEIDMMGC